MSATNKFTPVAEQSQDNVSFQVETADIAVESFEAKLKEESITFHSIKSFSDDSESPNMTNTRERNLMVTTGDIEDDYISKNTPNLSEEKEPLKEKPQIVHIDFVPDWLKDNKFLLRGYRVNYNRKRDLFKSLFSLHNETLNIWTHLVGALIFVALAFYMAIYFDEAKELFRNLIEKFKKTNIGDIVNVVIEKEIIPLIDKLKSLISGGDDEHELMSKAQYFKIHYETLIQKSKEISPQSSKHDIMLVNKFYWLIAQIKKLTQDSSHENQLPQLNKTGKLLSVLNYTNIIEDLEIWPILLYIGTAVFCLGSSATFHWFYPKSRLAQKILNRIDLASITILIWGSAVSIIYYSFYCSRAWYYFYFAILTLGCGFVFTLSMQEWWYTEEWRKVKGYAYIGLGVSAAISVIHCVYLSAYFGGEATDVVNFDSILWYIVGMGATYIIGTQFYIWRIPERWKPGHFDIWFNSHTIFHGFVFGAAIIHYFGLSKMYMERGNKQCIPH